jgi:PAS domain S-box-containing protein
MAEKSTAGAAGGPAGPAEGLSQLLFAALPEGVLVLDDEGRCVEANPALCQLLGRTRSEILASRLADLVPPAWTAGVAHAVERLRSGGSLEGEVPLATADGTLLDLEWSSRPRFAPGLHLFTVRDVRERVGAERRLVAEHAVALLLREVESLAEAAPGILAALCDTLGSRVAALWQVAPDGERLRCVSVWSSGADEAGLEPFRTASIALSFARGEGLPGRVWGERTAAVIADLAQDLNFPRRAAAAQAGLTSGFGFPITVGDELFGVFEFFAQRVFVPDEPQLLMMTAISHDVGRFLREARAQAEVERLHRDLARKTEEHETIFNSVPALIWYKDDRNNIVRVNRRAAELAGLSPAQMEGRATRDLYPEEAESYFQDDLAVMRSGQPKVGIVEPIVGPDGAKRWVRTDKIPYRNAEGKVVGVIVFAVDLTDPGLGRPLSAAS